MITCKDCGFEVYLMSDGRCGMCDAAEKFPYKKPEFRYAPELHTMAFVLAEK